MKTLKIKNRNVPDEPPTRAPDLDQFNYLKYKKIS